MGTVIFGKCFCRRQSLNYVLAKENRPQWHTCQREPSPVAQVADLSAGQVEHLMYFVVEFAGFEQFL